MSVNNYKDLLQHMGHKFECVAYTSPDKDFPDNITLECLTCNEIVITYDKPVGAHKEKKTNYEKVLEFSQRNPKSVCSCGHTGDGGNSQHADAFQLGHGKCDVAGCDCKQFTWVGWTDKAKQFLKSK